MIGRKVLILCIICFNTTFSVFASITILSTQEQYRAAFAIFQTQSTIAQTALEQLPLLSDSLEDKGLAKIIAAKKCCDQFLEMATTYQGMLRAIPRHNIFALRLLCQITAMERDIATKSAPLVRCQEDYLERMRIATRESITSWCGIQSEQLRVSLEEIQRLKLERERIISQAAVHLFKEICTQIVTFRDTGPTSTEMRQLIRETAANYRRRMATCFWQDRHPIKLELLGLLDNVLRLLSSIDDELAELTDIALGSAARTADS